VWQQAVESFEHNRVQRREEISYARHQRFAKQHSNCYRHSTRNLSKTLCVSVRAAQPITSSSLAPSHSPLFYITH